MNGNDLIKKFDRQARMYEKKAEKAGFKSVEAKIASDGEGAVLEVAVGAGANFPYYHSHVEVTAVDFSPEMLKRAKEAAREYGIKADFIQADVESLAFAPDSFDTVVSTLSLCGYKDPMRMLRQFNRWCKKDGNILLMEHGISSNIVIASLQNALDPFAYRMAGCHQNRDMIHIIRSSGLRIEQVERYWMGMVHLVWAKPYKGMTDRTAESAD